MQVQTLEHQERRKPKDGECFETEVRARARAGVSGDVGVLLNHNKLDLEHNLLIMREVQISKNIYKYYL